MRNKMGTTEKKLKLQLFGRFFLTDGTVVLGEDTLHSGKLTRLLAYLLIHRDSILTHQELIEVFWENTSRSPESALKNLMYRLRTALKILGEKQFICTMPGAYRWNPEIEVETDYELFEDLITRLRYPQLELEEKKAICQDVILCYQGNVSTRLADEPWLLPRVTWYQSLYMDTVKSLCEIYESEGAWNDLEQVCNKALQIDVFDEDIHCWYIRSLHGQKKYDLAISHYEKTNKLFYETMGIVSSEKLRDAFHGMMQDTGEYAMGIWEIINEAQEKERPQEVFFCDYQVFRQFYRLEARRLERLGIAEYFLLLTVRRSGNAWRKGAADAGIVEGMDILERILRRTLRVGDVVSRYSSTQYVIMLPMCSYEASVMVAKRIKKRFTKSIGQRKLELLYELEEVCGTE